MARPKKIRAQVEAAEASYAAAQAALNEARAGTTAGERAAAHAVVAVAVAQRDMAAARLALLKVGARPEQLQLAEIGVEQARLGVERADVAATEATVAVAQAEAGWLLLNRPWTPARAALARDDLGGSIRRNGSPN